MDTESLRKLLADYLDTLRRNLEAVPRHVLKTTYKKPYDALCRDISLTASAYVVRKALNGIRIRKELAAEAGQLITTAIRQSGLNRQISAAAFKRQDISEIDSLAPALRTLAMNALTPLYNRHRGLYISSECLTNPSSHAPELYNDANGCVLRDNKWIPLIRQDSAVPQHPAENHIGSTLCHSAPPCSANVQTTSPQERKVRQTQKKEQGPVQLSLFKTL